MEDKNDRTIWQLAKFAIVGTIGGVIQFIVVNVLYRLLKGWTTPLPLVLGAVFSENVMGQGNSTWGYVVPFFTSNVVANTYQYFQNKRTTFKVDAPKWCFVVYFVVMVVLIFVATWLQGILNNAFYQTGIPFAMKLAPTFAVIISGIVYTIVLFPLEKFVLFKKRGPQAVAS